MRHRGAVSKHSHKTHTKHIPTNYPVLDTVSAAAVHEKSVCRREYGLNGTQQRHAGVAGSTHTLPHTNTALQAAHGRR